MSTWTRDERLRYVASHCGVSPSYLVQDSTYLVLPIVGLNAALGAALESIWYFSALMNYPADTGSTVEWISSAVGDDGNPAGVGMNTARVEYLDRRFIKRGATSTLNGVGAVAAGITDLRRVIRTYGASYGANEMASGNVDLRDTTTATVFERILANQRSSASARYTCPRVLDADGVRIHNCRSFVFDWFADSAATQGGVVMLCGTRERTGITGNPDPMPYIQEQARVTSYKAGDGKFPLVDPIELHVGNDLEVRGASFAAAIQCMGGFEVWEVVLPDSVTA